MPALTRGRAVSLAFGTLELLCSVLLTIFGLRLFLNSLGDAEVGSEDVDEAVDSDEDVYYPMSVNSKLTILFSLVCLVSWNEMYIHRNHTDKSDAQWGFGQVCLVAILI